MHQSSRRSAQSGIAIHTPGYVASLGCKTNRAELILIQMKDGKGKAPPSVGCRWLRALQDFGVGENRAAIHIRRNINSINAARAISGIHTQGAISFFLDKKRESDDSAAQLITTAGASRQKPGVNTNSCEQMIRDRQQRFYLTVIFFPAYGDFKRPNLSPESYDLYADPPNTSTDRHHADSGHSGSEERAAELHQSCRQSVRSLHDCSRPMNCR